MFDFGIRLSVSVSFFFCVRRPCQLIDPLLLRLRRSLRWRRLSLARMLPFSAGPPGCRRACPSVGGSSGHASCLRTSWSTDRSLVRVLLQIHPSGGDHLPFPRAWLPCRHCSAMFDGASPCTRGRPGGCGLGFDPGSVSVNPLAK